MFARDSTHLIVVSWIMSLIVMKFATIGVEIVGDSYGLNKQRPLIDLGFEMLPDKRHSSWLKTIYESIVLAPVLLGILISFETPSRWKRLMMAHTALLTLRAMCFTSTLLPDASEMCKDNNKMLFFVGGCYDLLFSGHMSTIGAMVYFFHFSKSFEDRYYDYGRQLCNFVSTVAISFAPILCLLLRKHYTVDVLLGLVMGFGVARFVDETVDT